MHILGIYTKRHFLIRKTKFYKNTSHYGKTTSLYLYLEQKLQSYEMRPTW